MDDTMREKLLRRRIVAVFGEINEKVVNQVTSDILELILDDAAKRITLVIDSNGGSAEESLRLYDYIRAVPTEVIGIVIGNCRSAAFELLQACRKRLATAHSIFLFHDLSTSMRYGSGDALRKLQEKLLIEHARTKELERQIITIFSERSGISKKILRELQRQGENLGEFLSAQRALDLNLIDEILTSEVARQYLNFNLQGVKSEKQD